jgi:hypothetical protein
MNSRQRHKRRVLAYDRTQLTTPAASGVGQQPQENQ